MKKYCGTLGGNWLQGLVFFWEAGQGQGRLCRDLGHKNSLERCLFADTDGDVKVGCTSFFSF